MNQQERHVSEIQTSSVFALLKDEGRSLSIRGNFGLSLHVDAPRLCFLHALELRSTFVDGLDAPFNTSAGVPLAHVLF